MRMPRRRPGARNWPTALALLFVAVLVALALGSTLLFHDGGAFSDFTLSPPQWGHPLGTDELGRDVLAGLIAGVRVSLVIAIAAAAMASTVGIVVGALSGYYGGLFDILVMRVTEMFQVMPTFIMAAMIVALVGPGMPQVISVIALLAWPQVARLMRGEVMRVRHLEYVDAANCLGLTEFRILAKEVIPNAIAPAIPLATLMVGQAVLLESSLGYLGLTNPEIMSWGKMLNDGQRFILEAWWLSLFPGVAIFCTVLSFNLIGDALGRRLDPRSASPR
jgi:peptide/nickel transport system permease protein